MQGAGMTAVDRLAILYLAIPVALFFLTWFKPLFGLPLGMAALAGVPLLFPWQWRANSPQALAAAVAIAILWTTLGGAGHFFYANWFDWHVRDAVLRDLVALPAPVTYQLQDGTATILRAPIAYYMVPALLGKIAGIRFADFLLYLWTLAGVLLFLLQIMGGERRWRVLACIAAVVVLFSGMDVLGAPRSLLDITGHKEWWAGLFQYSSDTTLLFWVPNHALPGWLAIALLYRCRDDPRFLGLMGWVGALTLLWAPLVSIGLLPFLAAIAWRQLRAGNARPLFSICNVAAAPLLALATALYATVAAGEITGASSPAIGWPVKLVVYALFVLVEFLMLAGALWERHRAAIDPLFFGLAVFVLLILPWFHFGPANDLVMRASIPALAVLMFAVVDGWTRPGMLAGRSILVTVLLAIGALTPAAEIARALLKPAWKPDLDRSVYEVTGGASPNYLATMAADSALARLLRAPSPPPGQMKP